MADISAWGLAVLGGYLMGSVPFGLVITRAAGLGDIRAIGSGNIGATNVLRTGRKDLAFATLVADSFKAGLAVVLFASLFSHNAGLAAGAAAFVGHCYPVWLGFRGGKGVATYAGLLGFASWQGGLFALTRISSLAALAAAAAVPAGAYMLGETGYATGILAFLSGLVFWTHRANLGRLMRGEEPRFGTRKEPGG